MERLVQLILVFGLCLSVYSDSGEFSGDQPNSTEDADTGTLKDLPSKDIPKMKCDYTYKKDADGYFRFHMMPLTFFDAKARCAKEGAVLASPIDEGLRFAMTDVMNASRILTVITGVHAKETDKGVFSSVEGVRLEDMPQLWFNGQPDNYNNEEQCISMTPDGALSDTKCSDTFPYFCFMDKEKIKRLTPCGPKHSDYYFDENSGRCYKLHATARNWNHAARICDSEHGNLAIINSDTEAEAVAKLFPEKTANSWGFIGFKYNTETKQWVTLTGETINEAGFSEWDENEPNSRDENQNCGGISGHGLLHDLKCDRETSFICEKDPGVTAC